MKQILLAVATLLVVAAGASADTGAVAPTTRPEIRPFFATYVPTGKQRDVLKDAALVGGQLALEMREFLHLTGSFAWSPNTDRLRRADNRVSVFQYDIGAEVFRSTPLTGEWMLRPFVGAGIGGRTYDFRDVRTKAHSDPVGYGALGTEFQLSRVSLRVEGRDYVSRFKGLSGLEKTSTRNDVNVWAALAYHLR